MEAVAQRFCYKTVGIEIPKTSSQDQNIRIVQMFKLITIPNCFIAIVTGCFSYYQEAKSSRIMESFKNM